MSPIIDTSDVLVALGLTLFAGLSTGIGSALAYFTDRTNTKFLSVALGFSAGVMIYISLVEILPEARDTLSFELGEVTGYWYAIAAFFGGILLIAFIDKQIPPFENPHEIKNVELMGVKDTSEEFQKLYRMGLLTAVAIVVHNFPEGLVTFASALKDVNLGFAIAIAIAIHNIPEGIAVSVPIFYATGDRKKAFIYSFLSGLSEPLGALLGFYLLSSFFNDIVLGVLLALVAGIMVFISFDELLPAAREFGEHHLSIYGLVLGMAVMAVSLLLFL